ncbi:hypothetical protein D3C80_1760740 [compost metagenome]
MVGRSMTPRRSGPNSSSRAPSRSTPGSPGRNFGDRMEEILMRRLEWIRQTQQQQQQQQRLPPPTYESVVNPPPPTYESVANLPPPSYGRETGNTVASQLSDNRSISGNSTPQSIRDNPVINPANTQTSYSRVPSPPVTPPPRR